jgi:hypothetical protein
MIRLYSKDDDDRGPLKDGETLRIPLMLMDAGWGHDPIIERDARDAAGDDNDDGGEVSRRKADDAYGARNAWLRDAWRQQPPAPAKKPDAAQPPNPPAAGDAAAQRASADAAWERKEEWLRNAWKAPR